MKQVQVNIFGDFVAKDFSPSDVTKELQAILGAASINVVNFEAPIHTEVAHAHKSGPSLSQEKKGAEWLERQGFNLITLANNHMMDYGSRGLIETLQSFRNSTKLGAGKWEEAYKPAIVEIEGIKIGFLALTHCEFGTLTDRYDNRESVQYGTAWINHPCVDSIIVETKKVVDYLIILPHAGLEGIEQPLPEWRERYKSFIDLGADAVIASHPHIIQGYEEYKSRPIFYSLGNFYFPWTIMKEEAWQRSICVSLRFSKEKLTYDYNFLSFKETLIKVDSFPFLQDYMNRILNLLNDDNEYIRFINGVCIKSLSSYDLVFYRSGMAPWFSTKGVFNIKKIAGRLLKGDFIHALNSIRCETHRYTLLRGWKLKHNIQ